MPTSTTIRCCSRPSRTVLNEFWRWDVVTASSRRSWRRPGCLTSWVSISTGACSTGRGHAMRTRGSSGCTAMCSPFHSSRGHSMRWCRPPRCTTSHAAQGLVRFADLVKPGGVVAVLGLAANDWWDWPYAAVAESARSALGFVHGHWEHSAPMAWPPPETYREMKRISSRVLPGVRYKRHLLGRYSLIWTKPQ